VAEGRDDYARVMAQSLQWNLPRAEHHVARLRALAARQGREIVAGTYEAGPGYALDGLNGARVTPAEAEAQERVMKSQAAAVATLDSFLAQATQGFTVQNFFTFGQGVRWRSHAYDHHGGGGYAPWRLLSLFNAVGPGAMLAVDTVSVPRRDLPPGRRWPGVADAPMLAVYATRTPQRLVVVVLSRRLPGWPDPAHDGYTPTRIDLPIVSAARARLYRMAGAFDAHDATGQQVTIEQVALDAATVTPRLTVGQAPGDGRGMPPASALIYVFDGVRWE
jgi:hypothetical protein